MRSRTREHVTEEARGSIRLRLGAVATMFALASLTLPALQPASVLAQSPPDALNIDEQGNVSIGGAYGTFISAPSSEPQERIRVRGNPNYPVALFESPSEYAALCLRNASKAEAELKLQKSGLRLGIKNSYPALVLDADGSITAWMQKATGNARVGRPMFELKTDLAKFSTTKVEVEELKVNGNLEAEGITLPIYEVDLDELRATLKKEATRYSQVGGDGEVGVRARRALELLARQPLGPTGEYTRLVEIADSHYLPIEDLKYKRVGERHISFVTKELRADKVLQYPTSDPSPEPFRLFPTASMGALGVPSDARLKADVVRIGGALARLRKLSGVTYRWNDLGLDHLTRDATAGVSAGAGATEEQNRAVRDMVRHRRQAELAGTRVGVLAQEVEAVLPQAVTTGPDGFKQVQYQDLIPLLVEAVKEQDNLVGDQAKALRHRSEAAARQEREIARLQVQERNLEAEIAGLRSSLTRLDQLEKRLARFEHASPPDAKALVAVDPRRGSE